MTPHPSPSRDRILFRAAVSVLTAAGLLLCSSCRDETARSAPGPAAASSQSSGTQAPEPASAGAARLSVVEGSVELNGEKAMQDRVLQSGDLVEVAKGAKAVLLFTGGARVELPGPTQARVHPRSLSLNRGQGWFHVERRGTEFKVTTPALVLAVRGTDFYVALDAVGGGYVELLSGALEVISGENSTMLSPGERLTFNASGETVERRPIKGLAPTAGTSKEISSEPIYEPTAPSPVPR